MMRPPPTRESTKGTLSDFSQLRKLFAYTRPYRAQLFVGMAAVGVSSALTLVVPQFVQTVFRHLYRVFRGSRIQPQPNGPAPTLYLLSPGRL